MWKKNLEKKKYDSLSIFLWNAGSLVAHNYQKLSSLQAFNSIHKFDLICISESFLNSSTSSNNPSLALNGYTLIRSDHPLDVKRGGVCIYYKETLPIKILNIGNLSECLVVEISYNNRKCFIISLYRSPSQNVQEFDIFIRRFENILQTISSPGNQNLICVIGDFNAKLSSWKFDDPDTPEGLEINALTSSYGLTQMITDPTHILPYTSTCIDLLFTNQPNMITKSGVLSSLHPNCHHQIIYAKINFKIIYPPPYERHIWHYTRANIHEMRHCLENINWERTFYNLNVDKQVQIFNDYFLNICHNYIPNETITINDKDPPWITNCIKKKIADNNSLYNYYICNGKPSVVLDQIGEASNSLNNMINESKMAHYNRLSMKLSDPKTSPKTYWSILKSFFGDRKIPVIPPIICNSNLVTDFKDKAELFNNYFSSQCSLINNTSVLPQTFPPFNHHGLSSFHIENDEILKLIRSLDVNKSHGFDNISARMLKMCDSSIIMPLKIIFNTCLKEGSYPLLWKKANITPIHKKGDKNDIVNYRPISVLPLCGKIFEKLIYKSLYNHFEVNSILNTNQSGFRTGDSCINQLLSITHNIFHSFDSNPSLEVRGVFLDISKAFDRVWHDGILFKLRATGIEGNLIKLIESFLSDRYQRVILNGQCSSWEKIKAGVPQGSILGPLLFLIYINDISNNLQSDIKLFADDTSIFSVVNDPNSSAMAINDDLLKIQQWSYQWKMVFNPDISKKAHEVIFSRKVNKPNHPDLFFNQVQVARVSEQKHLGVILDEKLNFNSHIKMITDKVIKGIGILRKLHHFLPRHSLLTIYKSFIRSHLDYADVIYDQPNNMTFSDKLESLQYNAALAITGAIRGTSMQKLYQELGLEHLSSRRHFRRLCLFHKIITNQSPAYLYNIIPQVHHLLNTRNKFRIPQFFSHTSYFSGSFFPYVIKEWNKLDISIIKTESHNAFRHIFLKTIRPVPNSVFDACDPVGLKLLTRLRLGLSHLKEHKFKHGFDDTIDPFCLCNLEVESTSHFFLRCINFNILRLDLMNKLFLIDPKILDFDEISLTQLLLFGNNQFTHEINSKIIKSTISYIKISKRFDDQLF